MDPEAWEMIVMFGSIVVAVILGAIFIPLGIKLYRWAVDKRQARE